MASQPSVKTPSVLAFEAKLIPSDGLMFSGNWTDRQEPSRFEPIAVQEKSVRGTISNRVKGKDSDAARLDAEVSKPNLQTIDVAALPMHHDSLLINFTLRVLGDLAVPTACNSPIYQQSLAEKISHYQEAVGFKALALRYAINLANGRFMWRNRVGAEALSIAISCNEQQWTFNGYDFSLRHFDSGSKAVDELATAIAAGLSGSEYVLIKVNAVVKLGQGQAVFPSQELVVDDKGGSKKGAKSKHLYQLYNQAAMHSQKLGNALRTIDTWYPDAHEQGPIAVEPYGSVTSRGIAYRQPNEKIDFYTLLDRWMEKGQEPDPEQQHYLMAMLIRGGVFGG